MTRLGIYITIVLIIHNYTGLTKEIVAISVDKKDPVVELSTNSYEDSFYYHLPKDIDSAIHYATLQIKSAISLKQKKIELRGYGNLSRAFYFNGDYANSYSVLLTSLDKAKKYKNTLEIGNAYLRLGLINSELGKYYEQTRMVKLALYNFMKVNDIGGINASLTSLGILEKNFGNYQRALTYYKKTESLSKHYSDFNVTAKTYGNIGNLYQDIGKYDSALFYYSKSFEIMDGIISDPDIIRLHTNMGVSFMEKGELDNAFIHLQKAEQMSLSLGSKNLISDARISLAEYYLKKNNYDSAINLMDSSYTYYKQEKRFDKLKKIANLKSRIYEDLSDSKAALTYYKLALNYEDSINISAEKQKIDQEQWQRKIDLKIEQLEEVKTSNLKLELQYEKEKNFTLISIVVAILLSIGLIFLFYNVRKKIVELRKSNQKNESVNLELSSVSFELTKKNETLRNIDSNIQTLKDEIQVTGLMESGKVNANLKALSSQLKNNLNIDEDWVRFKKHFETTVKGFFSSLKKKHPNLTQHDEKICTYLFLKMDSFEISKILNVTPGTVKKQRYRLRKKMNLPKESNISVYLTDNFTTLNEEN